MKGKNNMQGEENAKKYCCLLFDLTVVTSFFLPNN